MNNRLIHSFFIICSLVFLCTGCLSKGKEFRPDQVIENALNSDESISYYAENETIIWENETEHTTSTEKEWFHKDGSMRMETIDEDGSEMIITSDTQMIQMYDTESNELLEGNLGDLEDFAYSPKEEMLVLIEGIQETHTIEYIGEEEILGRKAHHIKASPRDKSSLNGEQEFWFDAEYWISLKRIFTFGDSKSEVTYTHFEVKKDLDHSLFSIEKTDGMEIIDLDELNQEHVITIDEMTDQIDQPVFYIPEDDSIQIESIEVLEVEESDDYYTLQYMKDGLPFLSLMIEGAVEFIHYDENPEKLQVNNQTIYYHRTMEQDIYTWNKDGIQYEIWMNDPSIAQQEILPIIEEMEQLQGK